MSASNLERRHNVITAVPILPSDNILKNIVHAARLYDIVGPGHSHEAVMIRDRLGYSAHGEKSAWQELRERQCRLADDNDPLVGAGLLLRHRPDPDEPDRMYTAHKMPGNKLTSLMTDDVYHVRHSSEIGIYDVAKKRIGDGTTLFTGRMCLRPVAFDPTISEDAQQAVANQALYAAETWAIKHGVREPSKVVIENHTTDTITRVQIYPYAA